MPVYTQRAYTETNIEYYHNFDWNEGGGSFSFPCDEKGKANLKNDAAIANYIGCTNGTFDVKDQGIERREVSYRHRSYIKCEADKCSGEIGLYNFTNTCQDCGADYNMSGSKLAPRKQWGQETGEHWSECYHGALDD